MKIALSLFFQKLTAIVVLFLTGAETDVRVVHCGSSLTLLSSWPRVCLLLGHRCVYSNGQGTDSSGMFTDLVTFKSFEFCCINHTSHMISMAQCKRVGGTSVNSNGITSRLSDFSDLLFIRIKHITHLWYTCGLFYQHGLTIIPA